LPMSSPHVHSVGIIKCMESPQKLNRHGSIEEIYRNFVLLAERNETVDFLDAEHDQKRSEKATSFATQFRVYDAQKQELPLEIRECDLYIVTGSPSSAYDQEEWIQHLEDFVRSADRIKHPLIGICFGHQIVAQALGGKVGKSGKGWGIGVHTYSWKKNSFRKIEHPWFSPRIDTVKAVASHQDQVIEMPPKAKLLAGSSFCPIGMFAVGEHIWTIQTHPEFTTEFAKDLYSLRSHRFADNEYKYAVESLNFQTDAGIVSHWIASFLLYHRKNQYCQTEKLHVIATGFRVVVMSTLMMLLCRRLGHFI